MKIHITDLILHVKGNNMKKQVSHCQPHCISKLDPNNHVILCFSDKCRAGCSFLGTVDKDLYSKDHKILFSEVCTVGVLQQSMYKVYFWTEK